MSSLEQSNSIRGSHQATKSRLDAVKSKPTGYGCRASEFPTEFLRLKVSDEPYKGTDSYQFEDSSLFFGRKQEEREMASLFIKGRLCILHAQSGAGKTSLLNARVIPRIEQTGIRTVRLTPQSDPLESMRVASILQLIPPPECEATAIEDMLAYAPELADKPLEVVLKEFDSIESENSTRRELLAAFQVSKLWFDPYRYRGGRTMPFFCKLLAGNIDIRTYWRHFSTFFSLDHLGEEIEQDHWREASLGEIHALMASPRARAAHREWVDVLDLPEFGFVQFFNNFWREWADRQPGYALCLIIDQFEQIFTLYTDNATPDDVEHHDQPDWRLRPSFFDELRKLLNPAARSQAVLPISVVLSMRDEYVGQLASIRPLAPIRETSRYRLDFLSTADARIAIQQPALAFGYDYDDQIYDEIISALKKEDRFVEPAHIQIVCEKIWRLFGSELATGTTSDLPKISYEDFMAKTGGTVKIQQDYFHEILEEFEPNDQLEVLDMLSDLLTQSSKRNVVEYDTLVGGPLRDSQRRVLLVSRLQASGVVRKEARMGSQFVEIAHEFLITPLQSEILRNVDASERQFRMAQRNVSDALRKDLYKTQNDLKSRAEYLRINSVTALIDNGSRCNWTEKILELTLHAAVQKGLSKEYFEQLFHIFASLNVSNVSRDSAVMDEWDTS